MGLFTISVLSALVMLLVIVIATASVGILQPRRSSETEDPGISLLPSYCGEGESEYIGENHHPEDIDEVDRDGFFSVWKSIRERFDNDPRSAIVYADLLLSDLIPLDHAPLLHQVDDFAAKYSTAHEIAARGRSRTASRDELAQGMGIFNDLFDRILARPVTDPGT